MFKLETKDLILRDICEEDLKKHYTWFTLKKAKRDHTGKKYDALTFKI